MTAHVALIRGINVGGSSPLPMYQLVSILRHLGCRRVETYLQSGNAVFLSAHDDSSQLAELISTEIEKRCDFRPWVLILELQQLEKAIAGNPFPDAESQPASLHIGFLASTPLNPDVKVLEELKKESERFLLRDTLFYLHAPEGVGRSRLAARAERLLGVAMTARNWRTLCNIRDMARALS